MNAQSAEKDCTRQVRTLSDIWRTCGGSDPRCPECNPAIPAGKGGA